MLDWFYRKRALPQKKMRTLPPLEKIVFRSYFAQSKERNTALLTLLRNTALKCGNLEPEPFYSIRAVAKRFDSPMTAVSHIYHRLKEKGVLSSAWGSKTSMEPSYLDRQLRLRGKIALLIAFAEFCVTRQYRTNILSLSDELWKLGFASKLCFCEKNDLGRLQFFQAIAHQRPDAVVWFLESRGYSSCAHCFIDRGIRLIGFGQQQDEIVRRTLAFAQQPIRTIPRLSWISTRSGQVLNRLRAVPAGGE
jgi:hypothetical protein